MNSHEIPLVCHGKSHTITIVPWCPMVVLWCPIVLMGFGWPAEWSPCAGLPAPTRCHRRVQLQLTGKAQDDGFVPWENGGFMEFEDGFDSFDGIFMGFLWDFYGILMGFLCDWSYVEGLKFSGWWWLEHFFVFPFSWECHYPNWLIYFSEGWLYYQPGFMEFEDGFDGILMDFYGIIMGFTVDFGKRLHN